jgi:hypothetical protein
MAETVKTHLRNFHLQKAVHHASMADQCNGLAEQLGGSESDLDKSLGDSFGKMADAHNSQAEYHKAAAASMADSSKAAGMSEDDLNRIVPDNVRGIMPQEAPQLRAVPRHGSPELVDVKGVPVEFQKLISVEE